WTSSNPSVLAIGADGSFARLASGTAQVTGRFGAASATSNNISVLFAPAISTTALPSGQAGAGYSQALAATGDAPITWSLAAGALPPGMTLTASGLVTGIPTASGSFSFTAKATNAAGSATKALKLTVAPPTTPAVPVTRVNLSTTAKTVIDGQGFTLSATVSPANATDTTVTWSSSNPAVATVNATTGAVAAKAVGSVVITATAAGGNAKATCTVKVNPKPPTGAPKVSAQPASAVYYVKQTATALKVTAASPDGGTLSYQWYSNTTNSTTGAKLLTGQTKATYTPPTTKAGVTYYFCKVTNKNTGTSPGTKAVNSGRAAVRVTADLNKRVVMLDPTAKTSLRLEIPGQSKLAGVQAGLWANNSGPNQRYYLTRDANGLYRLKCVDSGLYLTVKGGKVANGTPIVQAASSTSLAQRFKISYEASGQYTLVSALNPGYVVAVAGTSVKSGAAIVLQKRSTTSATQTFKISTVAPVVASGTVVTIKNSLTGRYIDISGASLANNAPAITWSANSGKNQRFLLTFNATTGYYTIAPTHSGKALSVKAGAAFGRGTQLFQSTSNSALAQQWDIKLNSNGTYTIYQPSSRFALSAEGGSKVLGTPVIIWPANGAGDQAWVFKKQ
ncbi:MAG: RICIN domain-containing protein, partial [Coriobacteriia bacterium]|nr:RICIN domain-containing protein [Coriobacteriia bacterium]